MTGISLVTKGKICKRVTQVVGGGIGGVVYRDRYRDKKPSKEECETLYFPKVHTELIKIIMEQEKKFTAAVTFLEAIG